MRWLLSSSEVGLGTRVESICLASLADDLFQGFPDIYSVSDANNLPSIGYVIVSPSPTPFGSER